MERRERRLEKGILSLERQIKLHEIKRKKAVEIGQEELVGYYTREIKSLIKRMKDRKMKLKG